MSVQQIFSAISTYSHLGFLCRKTMICLTSATSFKLMCSKSARKRNILIQSFSEIVVVMINNENIFNQMLQTRDLVVIISVFHFKDVTRKLTWNS